MMCSRGMKKIVFSLYSAWVGDYCEEDLDGCSEFSCFPGVQCFDVPAPGSGAVCGPCPMGYVKDEEKCAGKKHHCRNRTSKFKKLHTHVHHCIMQCICGNYDTVFIMIATKEVK